MDMEVEVVEAISTENMMRMEEAANIAATAFGDDHISVLYGPTNLYGAKYLFFVGFVQHRELR